MQFDRLKRRDVIALLGGAAVAWPTPAQVQQSGKLPVIGFLGTSTPSGWASLVTSFVQRLRELGWVDGRTVSIEYRWAAGLEDRYQELAVELVRLKVDVIVTSGGAVPAAKQATSTIPIVFAIANDPLGTGLVSSLARPGGNVTGLSAQSSDLAAKRLELLRELAPGMRTVAIMGNVSYPAVELEMSEVEAAARGLGLGVVALGVRRAQDITSGFATLRGRADTVYVCSDALIAANRTRINTLAAGAHLPTMHANRDYVEAGGLMSYGSSTTDLFRRSAELVDKILRGTKPGNISIEQPVKFELVINLIAAQAIGLDVPATVLARADEVIE